jgi:hypothetical protein
MVIIIIIITDYVYDSSGTKSAIESVALFDLYSGGLEFKSGAINM